MSNQYMVQQVTPIGKNGMVPDMPDVPDVPDASSLGSATTGGRSAVGGGGMVDFGGLVSSFQTVAPALATANSAEQSFLHGHGNLLEMVLERAKADTLLSLASATASKATQAASTLMNLQV